MKPEKEIFVVEDSDIIRKMIIDTIDNMDGFSVQGFANGEDLLLALISAKPALIFVDYYLDSDKKNRITGETVIIEAKKRYPDVPAIVMTGTSQRTILDRIKLLPIVQFIHKDEDDILDQIELAIQTHSSNL